MPVARVEARKGPESPGESVARGIQFLLPSPRPPFQPPGPRACRAPESTVNPILMYLLPVEVARFAFHPAGPGLHLYRITRPAPRGGNPLLPRPPDPLVPLRLGHCTRFTVHEMGTGQE